MPEAHNPVEVFCSYAHADESWLNKLRTHLSMLKNQGLISTWYDRQIGAGTAWMQDITTHLNSAPVILLLISPDFLASPFCYGFEMQRAMERHRSQQVHVIPILVRPVDNWQAAPFAELQALPTDAQPISLWQNEDLAFVNVAAGIRRAIKDLSLLTVLPTPLDNAVTSKRNFDYYVKQLEMLKKLEDKNLLRNEVVIKMQEKIVSEMILGGTLTETPLEGDESTSIG